MVSFLGDPYQNYFKSVVLSPVTSMSPDQTIFYTVFQTARAILGQVHQLQLPLLTTVISVSPIPFLIQKSLLHFPKLLLTTPEHFSHTSTQTPLSGHFPGLYSHYTWI